jgi:hypothetical protein
VPQLPQTAKTGRKDPKPRHVIGSKEAIVEGRRPDRLYVLAAKSGSGGVDDYLEAGYEVERYGAKVEDGCRIRGVKTAKANEPIEKYGHVLMSISRAEAEALVAEAQAEFDEIERQIITQRRRPDGLRGLGTVRSGDLKVESEGPDFRA